MAKPKMRRIRGEYRPFFEALFTGKDFNVLSPDAKLGYMFVKGLSGAAGIRVWPAFTEQLAELTGIPTPRMKRAISDLTASNWLQTEGSIVWVVRGIDFEPQMVAGNPKHQVWLREHLDSLPRLAIVDRFRAHNAAWFCAGVEPSSDGDGPGVSDRVSDRPSDTLSDTNPLPVSLTTSQSLSLTTTSAPVRAAEGSHRIRLAAAANQGITKLFGGEQPTPVRWDHAGSHQCADELEAAGVDIAFAESALFRIASTQMPGDGRAPTSLRYYTAALLHAWRAEEAHRMAATLATPGISSAGSSKDPSYFTAIRFAREGDAEWQAYCREHNIDWEIAA
jgi:hypothetical protein